MKTLSLFLAVALLTGTTVQLKTGRTGLAQSSAKLSSHVGYGLKPIPFSAVHHEQSALPRLRLWESTSGNWSGYAVPRDGTAGDTFSQVSGTWTVPTVTGSGRSTTYSSVWVGIDGYSSGSVEQIGTEQDWSSGRQQNYVWFEMYPSGAYQITGFPANPGDSISAQVAYVGQTTVQTGPGRHKTTQVQSVFQLTIINNSQNVSYTVPASYTTTASAARSSAEWIVEAPSSRTILPLANFGTVYFTECSATGLSGIPGSISAWTPDPLTMLDPSGGESDPSPLSPDGTAFSATYK